MENYKLIFWSLRFHGRIFFKTVYVEIKRLWQIDDNCIRSATAAAMTSAATPSRRLHWPQHSHVRALTDSLPCLTGCGGLCTASPECHGKPRGPSTESPSFDWTGRCSVGVLSLRPFLFFSALLRLIGNLVPVTQLGSFAPEQLFFVLALPVAFLREGKIYSHAVDNVIFRDPPGERLPLFSLNLTPNPARQQAVPGGWCFGDEDSARLLPYFSWFRLYLAIALLPALLSSPKAPQESGA